MSLNAVRDWKIYTQYLMNINHPQPMVDHR